MLRIARRISPLRRIGLPKALAEEARIRAHALVTVEAVRNAPAALLVRPTDEANGRRVSETRQVTLPAAVMDKVGLQVRDWVYVSTASRRRGLRVVPAATTSIAEVV